MLDSTHMRPATYLTYRELFDRLPTEDELLAIIRNLNAFQTAVFTARLSATYRHATWSRNPQNKKAVEKFQYWFASAIPDMETKIRIEKRFGGQNPSRRPLFHPLQFLNVMRLALISSEGDDNARPDTNELCRNQFGMACLMVSDLFLTLDEQQNIRTGSIDDRRKQLMLQFLASLEVSNPTPLRHLLFRAYATYRVALRDPELTSRIKKECGGLDIEKDFESHFGIPLFGWLSLVFAAQTMLIIRTQEQLLIQPENVLINRKTMLKDSTLTQAQIDNFFDLLSMGFDELRAEIRKERPVDKRLDFVPFKSKPFFVTAPDCYACIDYAFVTEKLHNGPYFLLSNKFPEKERWKVFNAWGLLFESYVTWLLRGLHGRHSAQFFPDTRWEDGEKSFDAVFVKKRMVIVMEFKGGFLPQNARYSNDLDSFMSTLQGRFGNGCTQLARDISGLFPATGEGKKLQNIPIHSNTLYVLPILVVQDLMLRTPFVNYFLNQQFQLERDKFPAKKSVEILPLNVVQITDLESLLELAEAIDLDVMHTLHRRCKESPDMLKEIPDVVNEVNLNPEHTSPRFDDIYQKSNDEMCAILFQNINNFL
jgi:hypothetical protein